MRAAAVNGNRGMSAAIELADALLKREEAHTEVIRAIAPPKGSEGQGEAPGAQERAV